MNDKALAVGAVLGFVLALSPACGGGDQSSKCKDSCSQGCCDPQGRCITATTPSQCGTQGQNCFACAAGFSCVSGICAQDPAVIDGGCPAGCPLGCCMGNVCIDTPADGGICGINGVACHVCGAGQECIDTDGPEPMGGVCRTTESYGQACTQNSDCAASGPGAICKQRTTAENSTYQGGYCTRPCSASNDCTSSGLCLNFQSYGEVGGLCYAKCGVGVGGCRTPGYACYGLQGSGDSVCWIDPLPNLLPSNVIGTACSTDTQCQADGRMASGFCFEETLDGGSTGFTGGYCMADCSTTGNCPNDAICLGTQTQAFCFALCAASGQGQSDCRSGYVCNAYGIPLPGGGTQPSTDGFCFPSCDNPGRPPCPNGSTCDAGYCR
jgi:hypothetical protein